MRRRTWKPIIRIQKTESALYPISAGEEIRPTRWSGIQDIETLIVYSPEHLTKYSTNAAFMPGVDRSKSPDAVTTKRKWSPSRIRTFIPD